MQKRLLDLIWDNLGDIRHIGEEERKWAGEYDLGFQFRGQWITLQKRGDYVDTPYSLDGLDKAPRDKVTELYDYLVQERLHRDRVRDKDKADRLYADLTDNRRNPAKIVLYATVLGVAIVAAILVVLNLVS